jgi:predicted transcriptional regulator
MRRALLISIHPRFANAILDGTKTIELRRTMPTLPDSALALMYSSSPMKALVGWATVEGVVQATPDDMWRTHKHAAGVTSAEFDEYFAGKTDAFGLRLTDVKRALHAISLADLRGHGLEPPQSWRYVSLDLARMLCERMSMHGEPASTRIAPCRALVAAG